MYIDAISFMDDKVLPISSSSVPQEGLPEVAVCRREAGQELRAAGSLDQYPYCRTLPSSWPHGRGDLTLDIEFHSGTRTEHLPHARLWALEHDSDMTPALRCFMEQCGHLTHKQMTLSRMLKSEH